MTAYATPQDVYDLGLTAQAFVVRPRPLDPRAGDSLDIETGTFRMIGHGLTADDVVELVLVAGGAVPAGGAINTTYHPLIVDFFRFRLSLTPNGAAVTFADTGTHGPSGSAWAIQVDPERRLARSCDVVSRDIDQDLVAHATPIEPDPVTGRYPDKLVGIVARTAARRGVAGLTFDNPAFKAATERLQAEETRDEEQRGRWRAGAPLLPRPLDQTPTLADASARGAARAVSSGVTPNWNRGYL